MTDKLSPDTTVYVILVEPLGGGAGDVAPGITRRCPTCSTSLVKLFALLNASVVVPKRFPITDRLSPDTTVYVVLVEPLGDGAGDVAPGITRRCPTCSTSLVKLFALLNASVVVPKRFAITDRLSPDTTVYVVLVEPLGGGADDVVPGITRRCPTCSTSLVKLFAFLSATVVVPKRFAMTDKLSPDTTVYVVLVEPLGGGAGDVVPGITRRWPTCNTSLVKLFALLNASVVVPKRFAITDKLSPDTTVYMESII
jgi:uncharacterized protein with PIN domain